MNNPTATPAALSPATVVFSMGLPAAGKSSWIAANLEETHTIIDPDAIKETHADYDPSNPHALHAWSQEIVEGLWADALAAGAGQWVVDGTGTNAEKMVRRISEARAAGYRVELVYVTCTLETSLRRNAARPRVVPPAVVKAKALDISTSFSIVAPHADTVQVVDNNANW